MKRLKLFCEKLSLFSCRFVRLLALGLTGFLFLGAFFFTCYSENMETQQVLTKWDNPLSSLLGLAVLSATVLGVLGAIRLLQRLFPALRAGRLLLFLVMAWCLFVGAALILFGRTVPAADSMSVYSAAEALAGGDTSVIHPTDSYLSYYPQQIGLVAFYELLIRFWKLLPFSLPAYHFIKCVNVLFSCVILLFQYKTVHLLWQNERTDCIYLTLAGVFLPFLMYPSFVYGEIPSFAAASIGFYCLGRLFWSLTSDTTAKNKAPGIQKPLLYLFSATVFLTLAVMLRKNSLIFIIAAVLAAFFQWLRERKPLLLVFALVCTICSLSILPLVQKTYEIRAHSTLKSGVPAISYLAMGMQESSRGNGWYNGFNFNTYQSTGMDTEETAALSRAAIGERLQYFRENPKAFAAFYAGKLLSQWADGTYACRQATLATFGGRSSFFDSLYAGDASSYVIDYCNAFQNLFYLGAFLFFVWDIRKNRRKENSPLGLFLYLGIIAVMGGFLFHIAWEANSRYIFLYAMLLLPYGARGLYLSGRYISGRVPRSAKGNA